MIRRSLLRILRAPFKSLGGQLLLLVFIAVLPAIALQIAFYLHQRERVLTRAEANLQTLARLAASEQERYIEGARQLLLALAELPAVRQGDEAACSALMAELLPQYAPYANLGAITPDGEVFCSAVPFERPLNVADRPWFQRALQTQAFVIGDYQIGRITGRTILVLAHPVLDEASRPQAVLFASVDLSWLNRLVARMELPPQATLTVFDRQGTILARHPDGERWLGQALPDADVIQAALQARDEALVTTTGPDGITCIYAVRPLVTTALGPAAYVCVCAPKGTILAEVDRQLARELASVALAALLALVVGWFGGGQIIMRPLKALLRAAQRAAAGDLSVRVGPSYASHEMGELSRAFDQMAEALQRRESERQKAEAEYQALYEQFLQAQKMEAVGRLAGGVAHDFNNLLTVINLAGQLALSEIPPEHAARQNLEQILQACRRATGLTRQLLAFSRRQLLEMHVLNLNDLLVELSKMLDQLIGEDIAVVMNLAPDLWPVRADAVQIEQAVLNLAVNARDAMPHGGTLTIETRNVTLDETYARQHIEVTPGDYVLLAISDTGVGMSEEVKAHLFEPFFTTKEIGRGTGLGLAAVYGIVKQHGGHIWVYSEVGQGTTFKIYLPRVQEAAESPPPPNGMASLPRGSETILVAEDDQALREIAVRVLRELGYTVLEAASGEEALRMTLAQALKPDLLLTDVIMPGMNGRTLAERLTALWPELKVLYISGYTGELVAQRGILAEGLALLPKPFSPEALACKVREVLDGQRHPPEKDAPSP